MNGRYGPYISYKGNNFRIPKGLDAGKLTTEDCIRIAEESGERKKKSKR
jgi:DNA topoisomerase-1